MSASASPSAQLPFELEALSRAINYQNWVAEAILPYMGRRIFEIGAGIGNMSQWLPVRDRLVLTESHADLAALLQGRVREYFAEDSDRVSVFSLDLNRMTDTQFIDENFDTIVSFNVLEHIEDDRTAVGQLVALLRASDQEVRRFVAFVPAQAWAISKLDHFYGHFRRYSAERIRSISRRVAPDAKLTLTSFNAAGLPGWVWTTLVLRRTLIDPRSVAAFDALCPYFKHVDNFLCRSLKYPFGQSYVWVLTLPPPGSR